MKPRTATPEQVDLAVRRFGSHRARHELQRRGLVVPIAGASGISFVQASTRGSLSLTLPSAPTAGNALIVISNVYSNNSPLTGVSGGGVSSWTRATSTTVTLSSGTGTIDCWYGLNSNGSSSAVTLSGSGTHYSVVSEFSGIGSFDQVVYNLNVTTGTTASLTPAVAGELLIAGAISSDAATVGAVSPFTAWPGLWDSSTNAWGAGSYYVDSGTTATTTSFTGMAGGNASLFLLAFQPAGASSPSPLTSPVNSQAVNRSLFF